MIEVSQIQTTRDLQVEGPSPEELGTEHPVLLLAYPAVV